MGRITRRFSFYLALFAALIAFFQNQHLKKIPRQENFSASRISGIILKKISENSKSSTYIFQATIPHPEKFLLRYSGTAKFLSRDILEVKTNKIQPLRPAKNPGEFSWQNFYGKQKIWREILVTDEEEIVYRGYQKSMARFFTELREKIDRQLNKFLPDKNSASIAGRMLFGSNEYLDNEWRKYFVNAGVMHILVVSGLHVGYIAVFGYWIFSLTGIRRRYAIFFLTPLLLFYWQLCLKSPPVSRATIMTLAFLTAFYLKRESEVLNTFCLAVATILLFDPTALSGASFQLSFTATLGLILGVTLWPIVEKEQLSFWEKLTGKIKSLVIASLSAQIFTLPLIAYYFGRISLIALIANIFIIPLAGVVVWLGAVLVILGTVPLVGIFLSCLTNYSVFLLRFLVRLFGNCSFSSLPVRKPDIYLIVVFYFFLLVILGLSRRNKKYLYLVIPTIFLFLLSLKVNFLPRMQLTFLAVGTGRAAVLQTPDNQTILIDCGAINEKNACRVVCGFLATQGINKINTVIITDDNYLYFNALETLISQYEIAEIILPPKIVPESELNTIKENFPANINCLRPPTYLNYGGLELFFFGENQTTLKINYRHYTILILGNSHPANWPTWKNFFIQKQPVFVEITNFGNNWRKIKLAELIPKTKTILISRQDNSEKCFPIPTDISRIYNLKDGAVTIKITSQPLISQYH